ncbi:glycosyltransferase [bacterium]|nr:glycosyltransferase [bacterium]
MSKVVIIIPAYNEAATIAKVITSFRQQVPTATIVVYDNNSTDDTAAIARQADSQVIIVRETRQGKGEVLRRAFRELEADCYLMVDADNTYPADAAPAMIAQVIEHGADMVLGDRLSTTYATQNKRPFHNFGNSLVRASINFIFGAQLQDIMTGYRAFSRQFVKSLPILSRGFEIETEMSIHAVYHHFVVTSVPIDYRDRPQNSPSKLHTFRDGVKVLLTVLRLFRAYRPLTFFGGLAIALMILAIVFFIPVLLAFWRTGEVRQFPTLIVCGFTFVAGLLSFFVGLILSSLEQSDRRQFELYLNTLAHHHQNINDVFEGAN